MWGVKVDLLTLDPGVSVGLRPNRSDRFPSGVRVTEGLTPRALFVFTPSLG
jgi:hypothetical protein